MTERENTTHTENTSADQPAMRVLVALDASPHSAAALRAAARLAATMHAELHGLFVEDDRLLGLCNSPFSREVGTLTATVRPMTSLDVERKLRVMAATLRQQVAFVAAQAKVRWSFDVRRGAIDDELLAASEGALLLSLGRTNRFTRRGLGSTARRLTRTSMRPLLLLDQREELQGPVTLIYDGSASAQRALQLASQLIQQPQAPLTVMLMPTAANNLDSRQQAVAEQFAVQESQIRFVELSDEQALTTLIPRCTDTLILPMAYRELLTECKGPILLVP